MAMDYQVSRIREAYAHGQRPAQSVATGFGHSARVVVAAALIMTSVFADFVTSGQVLVKMIGFGLAAVLLDAFVVRATIVPAVLALLGRRAWLLPRWLDKALPHIDIEGQTLEHRPAPVTATSADAADAEAAKREVDEEVTTATMAAVDAETTGDAAAAERARHAGGPAKARQTIAAVKAEYGAEDARRRMMAVAEWREFIREPLRRNREEMRSRGMIPPALPPDIELGEDDAL